MKVLLFAALMVVSGMVSAAGAAYLQEPIGMQKVRVVEGQRYYGRNPTEDRVFTVTTFESGAVALVSMLVDGSSHEIYSGMLDSEKSNWAYFHQYASSESYRTHGYLEDEGDGHLVWYVEWCTPMTVEREVYTPLGEWIAAQTAGRSERGGWWSWVTRVLQDLPALFTRSVSEEEVGCPVPSRQYIELQQIQ